MRDSIHHVSPAGSAVPVAAPARCASDPAECCWDVVLSNLAGLCRDALEGRFQVPTANPPPVAS